MIRISLLIVCLLFTLNTYAESFAPSNVWVNNKAVKTGGLQSIASAGDNQTTNFVKKYANKAGNIFINIDNVSPTTNTATLTLTSQFSLLNQAVVVRAYKQSSRNWVKLSTIKSNAGNVAGFKTTSYSLNNISQWLNTNNSRLRLRLTLAKKNSLAPFFLDQVVLTLPSDPVEPPVDPSADVTTQQAARFLTQATFGPTEASINALVEQNNLSAWIDEQMSLAPSHTLPYVKLNSNGSAKEPRHYIWWDNVIKSDDQLRQRVAFALSEFFVVSDLDYTLKLSQHGISQYYDMLIDNAFGNYRELLEKVTLHPVMGIYLGMVRNQKANDAKFIRPDENYAREVLQLFSIGLHPLTIQGEVSATDTYSQDTVEAFARVFTGWNFANSAGEWTSNDLTTFSKELTMIADYQPAAGDSEHYHDTDTKILLNGEILAASDPQSTTSIEDDLAFALDNIANHPNVAPFVSQFLIQRLTTSNPSPEYIERVATRFNNNGQGERGDLGAVVKAILLDEEAQKGRLLNPDFGKVKEPILMISHLWRAFNAVPDAESTLQHYRLYGKPADRIDEVIGQAPLRSPSVFNFFLPTNPLSAGNSSLVSPEIQIMTEANIAALNSALYRQITSENNHTTRGSGNTGTRINIDKALSLAANSDDLITYLNGLLLADGMTSTMKSSLKDHLDTLSDNKQRALDAIAIIVTSPQFMLQL